jgi:hypothetical protein
MQAPGGTFFKAPIIDSRFGLPSADVFKTFVYVIEICVALSVVLALALLAVLIALRSHNARIRARMEVLDATWRDLFAQAAGGEPLRETMPALFDWQRFAVMRLYLECRANRESDRLDEIARRAGFPERALSMLRGNDADKILALNVLGALREAAAFDGAVALCSERSPELSRAAAHCALRVDPEFLPHVLRLIGDRSDWVRSRVEAMLRETSPSQLTHRMAEAIAGADDEGKTRLLDFVRFCSPSGARSICRVIFAEASSAEAIAAALRSLAPLASDEDHVTAVQYCRHPDPIVVISALRVLRRCVRDEDRALLAELTAGKNYWVRLRAAEAVVELYGQSGGAERFMGSHPDRFARDAVRQALSERRLHVLRRAQRAGTAAG